MSRSKSAPNIILRWLWMIILGYWITGLVYFVAQILFFIVITNKLSMSLMDKLDWTLTLRDTGGKPLGMKSKNSMLIRWIYFIFVGNWVGGIAVMIAAILALTFIGMKWSDNIMKNIAYYTTLA